MVSPVQGTLPQLSFLVVHSNFRAAAASLLSLKAEGANLEVVTSVKKQSGSGIVEVCTPLLFDFISKPGWSGNWQRRQAR